MSVAENQAVFLSYASQDAEAAKKICEALRAVGVEVWFDQNELVGGDAWDAKIRKQIAECALFVPVISAATQARREGYFRLEWRIAVQRTHMMSEQIAFLLPVVIDATRDAEADVPAEFKAVQWTRLAGGESSEKFCARVKKLLGGAAIDVGPIVDRAPGHRPGLQQPRRSSRLWSVPVMAGAALLIAGAAFFALRPRHRPEEIPKLVAGAQTITADDAAKSTPGTAPLSDARRLADRARALLLKPSGGPSRYETAGLLCDQALSLDPTDAEVWAIASQVDTKLAFHSFDRSEKRVESARSRAAKAINLAPASFEARLAQAMFQAMIGGQPVAADAESALRALQSENSREFRVLDALGVLLRDQGRGEEAVACFAEAAQLPGGAVSGLTQKAWALRGLWRFDEAEAALDQSIALQPIAGNIGLKVFLELSWRGDPERALATMRKLPADELTMDVGVAAAVRLYRWRREPAEVLKFLAAVPRDWLTWGLAGPKAALTGDAHAELNRPAAARADWQTALTLVEQRLAATPNDRNLLEWKAYLEASRGDTAQARATWQRSREAPAPPLPALLNVEKIHRVATPDQVIDELERRAKDVIDHLAQGSHSSIEFFSAADLRLNPAWDGVRGLPRFQALQARLDADPRFSPTVKTSAPKAAAADKSVAVLAFADLSAAHDSEYFSDGISEELLNVLAKIPGLKVSARTSSFFFKGKQVPLPEIARQLGVAYLIEGSVRKVGERVRITAQLIKAADGFHVWSENFDRDLKDVFAVQDEIAGLIGKNFQLKLGAGSSALSAEAVQLYLAGRRQWNLRSPAGLARAEELFNRALALEPGFARAHTALADVWRLQMLMKSGAGMFANRDNPEATRIVAKIQQALALDPNCAEAYASLGNMRSSSWQGEEAARDLRRAIALNPNYATAHQWLGWALSKLGYMDESLAESRRAAELDPLSHRILDNLASALETAGRYTEAWAAIERARALRPEGSQIACVRTRLLWQLGRKAEALTEARRLLTPEGGGEDPEYARYTALKILALAGLPQEAEALLPEFPAGSEGRILALIYLGRLNDALALLDTIPSGTIDLVLYGTSWREFDPARNDPRFQAWLKKVGLTEPHARAQAWRAAHPPEQAK